MLFRKAAFFARGAPTTLIRNIGYRSAGLRTLAFHQPQHHHQQQQRQGERQRRQQQQKLFSTTHAAMADAAANTSGVSAESLESALTTRLDAQHVEIEDLSGGCGQAFNAIIVSPQFEKKTMLARHRLVNSALKDEIAAIHAWTPKCFTPEQWEAQKQGQ